MVWPFRPLPWLVALLPAAGALAGGTNWVSFIDQTDSRLVADPALVALDQEEKDYAWGDLDQDGDIDLVVVRKQPVSSPGGRRNVLLMNENGVLTDLTVQYIAGFLDETNDSDSQVVDVNGDAWPDIVTAAVCFGCNSAGIVDDSRLYLNLGNDEGGNWLGFGPPTVLLSEGNQVAVAAGDITGDGYPDLYFVSANDNFEDQLLINGGEANPGVFTIENDRLTLEMRQSGFGTAAVIADMDRDMDNDIVKCKFHVVQIFRNSGVNGPGQFDFLDTCHSNSDTFIKVGDLNNDTWPDIVITEEGVDRYVLNDGSLIDGAIDPALQFPNSTSGFGYNSVIADLDGDGWNDVIIADVDVDVNTCGVQFADILRNNADPPDVSFTSDPANIPDTTLNGVYDFAIFDINGDLTKDLVIGRCNGTQIWMNVPPISISFVYPGGLPEIVAPSEPTQFEVEVAPVGGTLDPAGPSIHVSVNGGEFVTDSLDQIGKNLYVATLPATECSGHISFYLSAQLTGGLVLTDPSLAPQTTYSAIATEATALLFEDAFEGDVSGWTIVSDPSLTSGEWEQADPIFSVFGGDLAAPGEDATPDGTMAFVTENGVLGGPPGQSDVDFGPTYLVSPAFDLAGTNGMITYARWFFSIVGVHDVLTVEVSNDNGSNWTLADTVEYTDSTWETASFVVGDFVTPSAQVRVRFGICDCPNDSVTEAGIDDFQIVVFVCCPWDLDGDDTVGVLDFLALLAAWGPNPGHPADIDGDGIVGIIDFLEMLANWGGCP